MIKIEGGQTAKTFTDEVIYFGSAFDDVIKVEQSRDGNGAKMRKATKQRDDVVRIKKLCEQNVDLGYLLPRDR
jgi:hypothetical protein